MGRPRLFALFEYGAKLHPLCLPMTSYGAIGKQRGLPTSDNVAFYGFLYSPQPLVDRAW
jgi:hypothetical protein